MQKAYPVRGAPFRMEAAVSLLLLAGLIGPTGWLTPTTEIEICGAAKRHDRVPEVAAYRGLALDGYLGGVATMGCGDLHREIWLDTGGGWRGPFLVVDCAAPAHYRRRVDQGDVIEIGKRSWQRLGLPADVVPACVRFRPPEPRWPGDLVPV